MIFPIRYTLNTYIHTLLTGRNAYLLGVDNLDVMNFDIKREGNALTITGTSIFISIPVDSITEITLDYSNILPSNKVTYIGPYQDVSDRLVLKTTEHTYIFFSEQVISLKNQIQTLL